MCGMAEKYYTNMESGAKPPGRELLERAAEQAGFTFEDCISLPVSTPVASRHQAAIAAFTKAVTDWREPEALDAVAALDAMRKEKKVKIGGRTRKK